MTEEEAKTKWCPFARVLVDNAPSAAGNRWAGDEFGEANECIGSACMAWRLLPDRSEYIDLPAEKAPEGDGWVPDGEGFDLGEKAWRRTFTNRGGFCGLVGMDDQ